MSREMFLKKLVQPADSRKYLIIIKMIQSLKSGYLFKLRLTEKRKYYQLSS